MAKLNVSRRRDNLEKMLVYVLGVAPDEFGLLPDKLGFVPFKELLAAVRQEDGFRGVTEGNILEIMNSSHADPILEAVDSRVRVRPGLAGPCPEKPAGPRPKILFLGLKPTAWPSASEHGLRPKPGEERIRLFPTREAAMKVAQRFCPDPVIVTVQLAKAEGSGSLVETYSENLYSADFLGPEALMGPPVAPRPEPREAKAPEKTGLPGQPLGLFIEPRPIHGKKKGKYEDSPGWKTGTRRDRRREKG
ncbi:MAG: hypothetical protein LBP92_08525 [Deltaproteobacteria bacterium]|jgi:putative RNA 2'-phosphotransferase|nr:hypothetical protein [Deltaproteobacteria bacterium]